LIARLSFAGYGPPMLWWEMPISEVFEWAEAILEVSKEYSKEGG